VFVARVSPAIDESTGRRASATSCAGIMFRVYDTVLNKSIAMSYPDIFTSDVSQGVVARINKLTPLTKPLWGRMNVAQNAGTPQRPVRNGF
jgi:hypothetical protein